MRERETEYQYMTPKQLSALDARINKLRAELTASRGSSWKEAPTEKLTLYHGSGKNFNKFDIDKAGKGDLGYGLYFTPEKGIGNLYTNLDSSKIKKMWSKSSADEVIERRGGNPNPTLYKTEIELSPDQVYVASKSYDNQTPVVQSKIDAIIKDFDLPPIDKSIRRGWSELMVNLEEVGKVPEEVFSNYGIKALKRDTSNNKFRSNKYVGDVYYSVFDDSIIDIVDKTPIQ